MGIANNLLILIKQFSDVINLPFNRLLILVTTCQVASMFAKVILVYFETKKFSMKNMTKYGGMPSSHTAFITSFVFGVAFDPSFGWRHPFFTFSLILSCIVLIDAIKLRGTIDKLNSAMNIIADHNKEIKEKINLPKKIAHTPKEVLAGIIFAFFYTIFFYMFFFNIFPK